MLPVVPTLETVPDEPRAPARTPWSTPVCRVLDAGDATFGPNNSPEGALGLS